MDKKIRLISLDIETTGLDPEKHVPLSIGAVDIASGRDYFVGLEWGELTVETAAMRINRIDITRSDRDTEDKRPFGDSGPGRTLPAGDAIDEFGLWLNEVRMYGSDAEIRALGKNPGSFDLPMLRPTWERLWKRQSTFSKFPFSHRCVDLNSVFTVIAAAKGGDATAVRTVITELAWDDLRKDAPQLVAYDEARPGWKGICAGREKHYAPSGTWDALDEATGTDPEHHALADAWWNAYAWQRCILMLRGES